MTTNYETKERVTENVSVEVGRTCDFCQVVATSAEIREDVRKRGYNESWMVVSIEPHSIPFVEESGDYITHRDACPACTKTFVKPLLRPMRLVKEASLIEPMEKLLVMLRDPHPGIASWHLACTRLAAELRGLL